VADMRVAIAFTPVSPDQNPNIRTSAYAEGHAVYLQSMCVAFASVRRWNPDIALALVSTEATPDKYGRLLDEIGVELDVVPFEHQPPPGFAPTFAASLYMLDALSASSVDTLFVDPDVYCTGDLGPLLRRLEGEVGVLEIATPATEPINGMTLADAAHVYEALGSTRRPRHFGGEFYHVPVARRAAIINRAERAWVDALRRHGEGLPRFATEEHILGFALSEEAPHDVGDLVARIWTARRYRLVPDHPEQLLLWHLPSEKQRGFVELYDAVVERDSWFWAATHAENVRRSARAFGISGRRLDRLAFDTAGRAANALAAIRNRQDKP
jgi:hypothetical protein